MEHLSIFVPPSLGDLGVWRMGKGPDGGVKPASRFFWEIFKSLCKVCSSLCFLKPVLASWAADGDDWMRGE